MKRKEAWWRAYVPNTSKRLSLVSLQSGSNIEPDMRAHWPIRLTQIVGGKRWSLSLVWHRTPTPVLTEPGRVWLGREVSLERAFGEEDA